jgi:hypothetical protein
MILRHFLNLCGAIVLAVACTSGAHAQVRKPAAKPAGALAAPTTPDEAFLAAHAAFRAGDRERLARSAPLLEGHLLEQYVDYWRLKQRQDDASSTEIRAFLAKYPGSYLAERLRAEWLRDLGRRADWQTFDLEIAPLTQDDLEIRCYTLLSRLARKDVSAYDEAKEFCPKAAGSSRTTWSSAASSRRARSGSAPACCWVQGRSRRRARRLPTCRQARRSTTTC